MQSPGSRRRRAPWEWNRIECNTLKALHKLELCNAFSVSRSLDLVTQGAPLRVDPGLWGITPLAYIGVLRRWRISLFSHRINYADFSNSLAELSLL